MKVIPTKEDTTRLVAERKEALDQAKELAASPGNHVRGAMHVRQATEALDMAKVLLAEFK
jgi:hypothetical protein